MFKELDRLPYFLYMIGDDFKILGGQATKPEKLMSFHIIYDLWSKMIEVYQKDELDDEGKTYLAKSMKKMMNW